ncbi:hypothetical protein M9H77_22278 [Catharanthus roseus]|uniref:Uncharacterized protein n=1 Tax=Catharanthus roseus TaxID=4058 RepID=A0ACC0ARI1_CATRO|nr:hypothetical protein M9H77_22278 [Catharanthus roseus]
MNFLKFFELSLKIFELYLSSPFMIWSKKFLTSRDVMFDETKFPFASGFTDQVHSSNPFQTLHSFGDNIGGRSDQDRGVFRTLLHQILVTNVLVVLTILLVHSPLNSLAQQLSSFVVQLRLKHQA